MYVAACLAVHSIAKASLSVPSCYAIEFIPDLVLMQVYQYTRLKLGTTSAQQEEEEEENYIAPMCTPTCQLFLIITASTFSIIFQNDFCKLAILGKGFIWPLLQCRTLTSLLQMQALLQTWQKLDIEIALCLLDFHYPDTNVRKFACSCLEDLS